MVPTVETPVVPVPPPPPPPPPASAIVAGSCGQVELVPQATDTERVSTACSACMAEVDATQRAAAGGTTGNALHHRIVHCGPSPPTDALSSCNANDIEALVRRPDTLTMMQAGTDSSGRRRRRRRLQRTAPPDTGSGTNCRDCVTPVVTTVHTEGGFTTYQLSLMKSSQVQNVYTIWGGATGSMVFPAAKQVDTPFGQDIGGVSPLLFEYSPAVEWDSWLTVGLTTGNGGSQLSSIGVDFTAWTETSALTVTDG